MTQEAQNEIDAEVRKYIDLKDKADTIAVQMEVIRSNISNFMNESGVEQVNALGYGKFVMEGKRSWTYTPDIEQIEEELKKKKKEQQQLGTASSTETKYMKFYEEKA